MAAKINALYRQRRIFPTLGRRPRELAFGTFAVRSLPQVLDGKALLESMLCDRLMLCHNLRDSRPLLISESGFDMHAAAGSVPGFGIEEDGMHVGPGRYTCIVVYNPYETQAALDGLYRIFGKAGCRVFVSFILADCGEVHYTQRNVEHLLSRGEIRLTRSLGSGLAAASKGNSVHMDLYYNSDQRQMLTSMLYMLNQSMLANGNAYKICLFVEDADGSQAVIDYIRSRLFVLDESVVRADGLGQLFAEAAAKEAIPFSFERAATMLSFSDQTRRITLVSTEGFVGGGDVSIGTYLDGSIKDSGEEVRLDREALNLGTLICGVPGTGKTGAAMNLVKELMKSNRRMAVISPTSEWEAFGRSVGMRVVRLYSSDMLINFFKCDANINIEKFYENLSMLLACALNAGPYTKSLQKCLLGSFSRVYARSRSPDPVAVYDEIERVIIEQHGRMSNTGAKYTKHGENIKAALEDLRIMLLKPQFAYEDGVDIRSLVDGGVVFDLSEVSNNLKPLFYALILNQVYSYADELDTKGERELRMVICMEESQLVLKGVDRSAAMMDLEQRIQDFRKRGIGLILITHNVTDIDQGIRRLCQVKMYFRQSSDVAKYAANDLVFSAEEDDIANKLKTLGHRMCALGYVAVVKGQKEPMGSIFIKTSELDYAKQAAGPAEAMALDMEKEMEVRLVGSGGEPLKGKEVQLTFAGNMIFSGQTDATGTVRIGKTLRDKRYRLFVLGEKKRDTRMFEVLGGRRNSLVI